MQKKVIAAIIGTSAISAVAATQANAATTHTVKPGESVWAISNKYGISIAKLKSLNNLTSNLIFPNQVQKYLAQVILRVIVAVHQRTQVADHTTQYKQATHYH